MENKIWFVTGISSGLGRALAETLMTHDIFVIGTFRRKEEVNEFNEKHNGKGFAVHLELDQKMEMDTIIARVVERFGHIDVLVNNAGYGFAGAIEEASMEEVRAVFEVNFFGVMQLTKAVLPHMRLRGEGHIIQISSHGGVRAFAGFGVYNASKFALEGFSEALAQEVQPLGIKVTIVEPGPFRTGFAGKNLKVSNARIRDYEKSAGAFTEKLQAVHGRQEGDPVKAARAILHIAGSDLEVLRLPLGNIALNSLEAKLKSLDHDMTQTRAIASAAVF